MIVLYILVLIIYAVVLALDALILIFTVRCWIEDIRYEKSLNLRPPEPLAYMEIYKRMTEGLKREHSNEVKNVSKNDD